MFNLISYKPVLDVSRKIIKYLVSRCVLLILTFSLFFSGSVSALEVIGAVNIAEPLSGPDFRALGWQWHYIDQNGRPGYMEKVSSSVDKSGNELAGYERSDGCSWTRMVRGFAPAVKWSNCPSSGTASVDFEGGIIWPLQVGNSFAYTVRGDSTLIARVWSTKRRCNVTSTERIRITSGEYDTYKLVCRERFGTRTWWLSPEVGTAVVYEHRPKRGALVRQEFTKMIKVRDK